MKIISLSSPLWESEPCALAAVAGKRDWPMAQSHRSHRDLREELSSAACNLKGAGAVNWGPTDQQGLSQPHSAVVCVRLRRCSLAGLAGGRRRTRAHGARGARSWPWRRRRCETRRTRTCPQKLHAIAACGGISVAVRGVRREAAASESETRSGPPGRARRGPRVPGNFLRRGEARARSGSAPRPTPVRGGDTGMGAAC
jgi:hypothetical protein